MFVRVRNHPDFWAALVFATVALVFLWQSAGLSMGSAGAMGPAYLPRVLCGLMLVVSVVLFVRSLRHASDEPFRIAARPMLVVPLAMASFALSVRPLGVVAAIWLGIAIASFASKGSKPVEIALVALFLSILSVAGLVYGLRLNLPIWPGQS